MSHRIDQEVSLAVRDRRAGMAALSERFAAEPGKYAAWYASKPALLWSWNMRIAAGHIYVFPTVGSPLESNDLAYYGVQALVAANPFVAILALIGCALVFVGRVDRGAGIAALLLLYVTIVYGVLQSEPRYAVPFRGAEILMATLALAWMQASLTMAWRKHAGQYAPAPQTLSTQAPISRHE